MFSVLQLKKYSDLILNDVEPCYVGFRYSEYSEVKATKEVAQSAVEEKINEFSNWQKRHQVPCLVFNYTCCGVFFIPVD